MRTVKYTDASGETVTASFDSAAEAWNFVRLCDLYNVPCGYPSLGA